MSTSVKYFDSEMPGASPLNGATAGNIIAILNECLVDGRGLVPCTINVSGGVATATIAGGHAFQAGVVGLVDGAGTAAINGEKRITATTTNTVVFLAPGVADGAVPGTITIKLAPAGWVKAYAAGNIAAYKSSNPSASGCYVRIDDSGAGLRYARMVGYESMTDVDTGINASPPDIVGGWYIPKSNSSGADARKWIVVADDRRVVLMVAYNSSYPADYSPIVFGDLISDKSGDAWPFITSGFGDSGSVVDYNYGSANIVTHACLTISVAKSYSQIGSAVRSKSYIPGAIGTTSGDSSNPVGPSVVDNSLYVCPVLVQEGTATSAPVRGRFPGIYHLPQFLGAGYANKTKVTGVNGLAGRDLMILTYVSAFKGSSVSKFALDVTGPWT